MNVTRLTSVNLNNSLQEAIKSKSNGSFKFEGRDETILVKYQYSPLEKTYSVFSLKILFDSNNSVEIKEDKFLQGTGYSNKYTNKQDFISCLATVLERLGFNESFSLDSDLGITLTGDNFDYDLDTQVTDILTEDVQQNKINELVNSITIVHKENDARGHYHAVLDGKTIFKSNSEDEVKQMITDTSKEITEMLQKGEINSVIRGTKGDDTYFGITNSLETFLDLKVCDILGGPKNTVHSSNLSTLFTKPRFTRTSYIIDSSSRNKLDLVYGSTIQSRLLDFNDLVFTQDTYFQEVKDAYKEFVKSKLTREFDVNKLTVGFGTIELCDYQGKVRVQDGTHRVLALFELIRDFKKEFSTYQQDLVQDKLSKFISKLDIKVVDFKVGNFKYEDLTVVPLKEIDSIDNAYVQSYFSRNNIKK